MPEDEIKRVFSKNLQYFLQLNDKTPSDLVKDLDIPFSTVSNWYTGSKMPRMGKVEILANYFGIQKSDLLEDKSQKQDQGYYLNEETKKAAQAIFENRELRLLFDAAKDADPEDLKTVHTMLLALKRKERQE